MSSAAPYQPYQWAIFATVVVTALALDLLVFHRKEHIIGLREAAIETAGWIALALLFGGWVSYTRGHEAGLQFLTAYVVEESLSIDNIFVFILIFLSLRVPAALYHRVLFYGVAGALVMRGAFVWAGVELLQRFHAVMYLFAAILLVTAVHMLLPQKQELHPDRNWLVRLARLAFPVVNRYEKDHFFAKEEGHWKATSLLVALLAIEAMDIVFAADSVPAVLAISRDMFVAYSSNVFAILGLRALFFAVSAALTKLRYLRQGLAAILCFVAAKMILEEHVQISTGISLGVIGGVLLVTVLASLAFRRETPTTG
jgi:tellurite resistance protein TerC